MDEFLLELQAKLDEAKSKGLINADIEKIQQQVDKLKLKAEIDPKSISNIVKQLETFTGQKINISNINIDPSNVQKAGQQLGKTVTDSVQKTIDGKNINTDKLNADIKSLVNNLKTFASKNAGFDSFKTEINGVEVSLDSLIAKLSTVDNVTDLSTLKSQATALKTSFTELRGASDIQIDQTIIRLNNQLQNNTRYTKQAKEEIKKWIAEIQSGVPESRLKEINVQAKQLHTEMAAINKTGSKFFENLRSKLGSLGTYLSAATILSKMFTTIRNGISSVVSLDTALVDLKKTTNATAKELKDFYYSANDTAKRLGVTTESIISAAAAWSRLGYSIKDAQTMAENSAILTSISPDINSIDESTDALVSVLKAYKIEAEDSLDGVISKINIIGNTQAVSNGDIVEILTRSSSAMAEANNTLEQTIALGTAATEITRDAAGIGQVLKTTSMRIRGYDEQTESYSEDLEELSGKIADLTKTASTPGGISLFTDETKQTYKSTYDILKDISEIYDDLSDKNQAELLEVLAGKRNGQAIAAIISNFSTAEKSMDSMANSAGNAMKEMEIIYDSVDYKLNKLSETGTGVAQNLFKQEDMKNVLDVLNSFMSLLDKATEKLGLFGTLGAGAGLFAGFKNIGRVKCNPSFEYAYSNIVSYSKNKFLILPFVKYTIESRVELTTVY